MEITVTQRRDNALLDRTEVLFEVAHAGAGTPTRAELRKALAATLNAKDGVVVLDWARSEFGRTATRGYAKVYKSKEKAMSLETPPILIRNGLMQPKAKKEAAPKEAAPAPPKKEKEAAPAPAPETPKEAAKPEARREAPKAAKEEAPKKEAKAPAKEEKAEAKKEPAKEAGPKEKKPAPRKEGK